MTNPIPVQGLSEERTYTDLRSANIDRQAAWCPDQVPDLSFRGNELAGETGEVCNVIKKLERERLGWRGSRDTVEHLAEELADVVICADLCAISAGIDLNAAVVAKFNATSEKVGLPHRLSLVTELQHSRAEATVAENVTVAPDGWVLVPREPTPEMTDAMWDAAFRKGGPANVVVGYRNAVAVAPASPASPSATGVRVTFADLKRRAEDALDALTAYAHNNEALEDACGESDKAMDAATWNRVKAEQALSAIRDMSFKSAPPALSALVEQP